MFLTFPPFRFHSAFSFPFVPSALSGDSPTQRLSKYLPTLPTTHNLAVFVGAMARGRDDFADAYVDEKISISEYALSASVACGKVAFLSFHILVLIYADPTSFLVLLCFGRTLGHRLKGQSSIYWPPPQFCSYLWYFGPHFLHSLIGYKKKSCLISISSPSGSSLKNLHFNSQRNKKTCNPWHVFFLCFCPPPWSRVLLRVPCPAIITCYYHLHC